MKETVTNEQLEALEAVLELDEAKRETLQAFLGYLAVNTELIDYSGGNRG